MERKWRRVMQRGSERRMGRRVEGEYKSGGMGLITKQHSRVSRGGVIQQEERSKEWTLPQDAPCLWRRFCASSTQTQ